MKLLKSLAAAAFAALFGTTATQDAHTAPRRTRNGGTATGAAAAKRAARKRRNLRKQGRR